MKYLLIIVLLLSPSVVWSEDINLDDLIKRDGLYYEKFTDVPFTGEVSEYNENGQLTEKGNFKDGKLEGEYLSYFADGKLYIKGNYKDGKEEGEWLIYYVGGELYKNEIYKDGKLIKTITP